MRTAATPPSARPTVLVVDDYPPNIRLVGELLKDACDIYIATNGEQALAQAAALLPDLVLLDVVMPGMDGHEVCRRLKADARTRHIVVVFLSGRDEHADQAAALALGAAASLGKPVDPGRLRACVMGLLVQPPRDGAPTLRSAPG